jgi:AcrR family transcriptional regulator
MTSREAPDGPSAAAMPSGVGSQHEEGGQRAERSRETRERVLTVALAQVEEGGESAVRIDEIRDRSGVSIGSIYHHFGDREGVIAAVQLRRFADYARAEIAALSEIVERSRDLVEFRAALRQLTLDAPGAARTTIRWGRLGVLGSTIGRDELRDEVARIQTRLTDGFQAHIAQGQARGFFRSDLDPRAIAVFVEAYSLGFALNDLDEHGVDSERWQRVVWTVLDALLVQV